MTPEQDKPHFAQAAETLAEIKEKAGAYSYLFETQAQLNHILSSKVDVGRRIRQAYQTNDKEGLQAIARQELPKLRSEIEHFHALFSRQWLKENKVFWLGYSRYPYGRTLTKNQASRESHRGLSGRTD